MDAYQQRRILDGARRLQNGALRYTEQLPIEPLMRRDQENGIQTRNLVCRTFFLLYRYPDRRFAATLRAQTSGENHAYPFSSSVPSLSLCGQPADECLLNSAALDQDGSNLNDTNGSNSRQHDDWVHSWMRKVDEARASQPHFVSPIVTTHVMLVEQYRYDMSWQQDPMGGTVSSNYGASHGLELIPLTRLEVGIFPTASHRNVLWKKKWLGRRTKSPESKENRVYNPVPGMGSKWELA